MQWGPNGQEVFERTYARTKPDGTKETWEDTVARVVDGNLALVPVRYHLPSERERLYSLILNFHAIPAGRHLWTSGVPGRQYNRNCHRAGWGPRLSDHFTFLFSELMKGGGVGANYSSEYLRTLPPIRGDVRLVITCQRSHPDWDEVSPYVNDGDLAVLDTTANRITVEDSREGWVLALGELIDAFTIGGRQTIILDLSKVRERGRPISGFGGTASGPGPLAQSLATVHDILTKLKGYALTPLDAMALDHALATCVVAGNVRRSARMSILHWADPFIFDFIACKADHLSNWSTNISVEVDDAFFMALDANDPHATAVFNAVTEGMLSNGEPGFFNSYLASEGETGDVRSTNPCGEIALEPWESCNLGHVNLAAFDHRDRAGLREAFTLMARFLVRATFADLTDPRQAEVESNNRRIGVGIFGFQEWLVSQGISYSKSWQSNRVRTDLDVFRNYVEAEAERYANELGIPCPVKTTTVAPTGTIAKLPGVSEGIHPVYARFFERRIRYSADDPKVAELAAQGHQVEACLYTANTKAVVFHVKDTILERFPEKSDLVESVEEIDIADLLAVQAMVQFHYANNAVSFTANIPADTSLETLRGAVRYWLPELKGTTVMPDASRPQAPYTRITEEAYEAATDHGVGEAYDECASGACPVK
jgi:ribonucleoside-triphosphate reductase